MPPPPPAAPPAAPPRRRGGRRPRKPLAALVVLLAAACGLGGGPTTLLLLPGAHAQNVTTYSVRLAGAGGDDLALGMGLDGGGSAFVVGSFRSPTLSVGQRTNLTNACPLSGTAAAAATGLSSDAFIAKVTRFGQLAWAVGWGGWGDDAVAGVAVEAGSNAPAYVAGSFQSAQLVLRAANGSVLQTVIKGPDEKTWTALGNALVGKVDTKGTVAWVAQLGGADGEDAAAAVAVDAARGRVFVAGSFFSSSLPIKGNAALANAGAMDGFVAALSTADGAVQWAVGLQGPGTDRPTALAVDAATGAVVVVGVSDSAAIDLAAAAASASSPASAAAASTTRRVSLELLGSAATDGGQPAAFAARLDGATGTVAWAQALGPAGAASGTGGADPDVAVAANSVPVVLVGQDPPGLAQVVALDGPTGAVAWRAGVEGAQRLAVDAAGASVYLAGVFTEPLALGPVTLAAAAASRGGDLYMARLDAATGKVEAGASFGGGSSAVKAVANVALDGAGSVYMAGSYVDGGLGFSATLQPPALAGGADSFLARMAMGAPPTAQQQLQQPSSSSSSSAGRATGAPTASSRLVGAAVTTMATTTTASAAPAPTAKPTKKATRAPTAAVPSTASNEHNLLVLLSYAGPMEKVPALQAAVSRLLELDALFLAPLTPGIPPKPAEDGRRRRRRRALVADAVTPCNNPRVPRIDVPFFLQPRDAAAAADARTLLDGVNAGRVALLAPTGEAFDTSVLCSVGYEPTGFDATLFIAPPAPADDDAVAAAAAAAAGASSSSSSGAKVEPIQFRSGDIATIESGGVHQGDIPATQVQQGGRAFLGKTARVGAAVGGAIGGLLVLWLLARWLRPSTDGGYGRRAFTMTTVPFTTRTTMWWRGQTTMMTARGSTAAAVGEESQAGRQEEGRVEAPVVCAAAPRPPPPPPVREKEEEDENEPPAVQANPPPPPPVVEAPLQPPPPAPEAITPEPSPLPRAAAPMMRVVSNFLQTFTFSRKDTTATAADPAMAAHRQAQADAAAARRARRAQKKAAVDALVGPVAAWDVGAAEAAEAVKAAEAAEARRVNAIIRPEVLAEIEMEKQAILAAHKAGKLGPRLQPHGEAAARSPPSAAGRAHAHAPSPVAGAAASKHRAAPVSPPPSSLPSAHKAAASAPAPPQRAVIALPLSSPPPSSSQPPRASSPAPAAAGTPASQRAGGASSPSYLSPTKVSVIKAGGNKEKGKAAGWK